MQRLELPRYDKVAPNQLISAAFYPIGFSANGKFAHAIAPADEACGCYFFELRVQDLITDKILYRYAYHGDQGPEAGLDKNFEGLWGAKSAMLNREMERFGIVRVLLPG